MSPPKASRSAKPSRPQATRDAEAREHLQALRELLADGVLLPTAGVQDALDQAVRNGRMLRRDAEELARGLLESGRRQTQQLAGELEQLLGLDRVDAALPQRMRDGVQRARRATGVGPSMPITGYDDLTVREITTRLDALSAVQLRRVRDHERAGKARKGVLGAVERALS